MIYLLAALVIVGYGILLWRSWREDRDILILVKGTGMVGVGIFFIAFTRSMSVHKPLMVLHLAATLLFWYATLLYLVRREIRWLLFLAPVVTMALFFIVAWFFREA